VQVFRYETVESTNETAKRLIGERAVRGPAYVTAREQTAGKGTRGRKWASPKDAGIYLSVIEIANGAAERRASRLIEPTLFTLAAGVACAECLRRLVGVAVELKPINDLYAEGGKLGGILTEAVIERGTITALVTGIGINVLRVPRILEDTRARAISLEELLDPGLQAELDVERLARAVAEDVHVLNQAVWKGDQERIRWAWEGYRMPEELISGSREARVP
jgi:BirA family biotin operon repressor/biotin-[acetyl-CoA-carboxylase] ligase